jgi:hypothetical protein
MESGTKWFEIGESKLVSSESWEIISSAHSFTKTKARQDIAETPYRSHMGSSEGLL